MTGADRVALWDLDGTLIGWRRIPFRLAMPAVAAYTFRDLVAPPRLLRILPEVLGEVRANSGESTNSDLLVRLLAERTGVAETRVAQRYQLLAERGFPRLRRCFPPSPQARAIVAGLTAVGRAQVVATNPLWPERTVVDRLRWGGYDPATFTAITSGDTMRRAKPRREFYAELLDRIGLGPGDCVMIGNDPVHDAPAALLGIPVFVIGVRADAVPAECARTGLVTTGDWPTLRQWLDLEERPCS